MKYIILDMEWDSAYFVPQKRFINQILQIGAVKLDESFNIIDTFDVTIRSSFSRRVSRRFVELTGITKEMMLSGVLLEDAVKMYNEFVGENCITMTWSTSDLYTIIENQKVLLKDTKFRIDYYLDLQKFIQGELRLGGYEEKSQISLSNAAELLKVNTEQFDLHTAKDDSTICALLLKTCYNERRFNALVKDTSNPEFYTRLSFKPHYISDINSTELPKNTFEFICPFCDGDLTVKKKWHFHNRNFTAEYHCPFCDKKLIARVSARKTYDDLKIQKKIFVKKEKQVTADEV